MVRACVVDAGRDSSGILLSSVGGLRMFECSVALRDTFSDLESPLDELSGSAILAAFHPVLTILTDMVYLEILLLRISRSLRLKRERDFAVSMLRLSSMVRIAPKVCWLCPPESQRTRQARR